MSADKRLAVQNSESASDWRTAIDQTVDELAQHLIDVRHHLHAHPEPSGEEFATTRYLADHLSHAGIPVKIVEHRRGIISGVTEDSPCVGMRADMDALWINDEKSVDYRSRREGVMHACGHDVHSTMVLGAALALQKCSEHFPWPVPWRAIFQPSEETAVGAEEMSKYGALQSLKALVALHVDPELPVGTVATRVGALTAFCESLNITIRGKGGHAARPHHTVDSIATAIQLVNSIYQFVPRSIDSREPVVVSFGVIEGGENPNVIPEQVVIRGTIRTISRVASAHVKERIRGIAHGLAEASGAKINVSYERGPDAVINDEDVTCICRQAAVEFLGDDQVQTIRLPSMGGEDFSAYLAHVPGCMFRLGAANGAHPPPFLHSAHFDIDESAIVLGAKFLARCLVHLAKPAQ